MLVQVGQDARATRLPCRESKHPFFCHINFRRGALNRLAARCHCWHRSLRLFIVRAVLLVESRGRRIRRLPGSSVAAPVLFSLVFRQWILKVRDHRDLPVGELRLARPIGLEIRRVESSSGEGAGPHKALSARCLSFSVRALMPVRDRLQLLLR